MQISIDKRDRSAQFKVRLGQAMAQVGASQSGLARAIGVDRSTISQLLRADQTRLPSGQVVAECAAHLGVSSDWLLGLSDWSEPASDLVASAVEVTEATRALIDESILSWHKEAEGYKIRTVPATLPDFLKTEAMLSWEYSPSLRRTSKQAISAATDGLAFLRRMSSDFEVALRADELQSFAEGTGYYADCPVEVRREQLDRLITLYGQLYPKLRMTVYDARMLYSAPLTVFGPLLAVVYLGRNYLAFRDRNRVQALTGHFDGLVREALVTDRDIIAHLQGLADQIGR